MEFYVALQPLVALIAGILILIIPRLLNYVVALYLIITGILGLVKMCMRRLRGRNGTGGRLALAHYKPSCAESSTEPPIGFLKCRQAEQAIMA